MLGRCARFPAMNATQVAIFFVVFLAMELGLSAAEVRWCAIGRPVPKNSFAEDATQYDDEVYACMRCAQRVKLILREEMSRYECCNGDISLVGTCSDEDLLHSCSERTKCDGLKHCYDGRDELGCYECSNDTFGCNDPNEGRQCLTLNKLCDSVKDCKDGRDETLCPFYGGWCSGYACGGKHPKCIQYNKVCDGLKDCLDGSDESNCQYCPNQFRCRVYFKEEVGATSAECIGRFRVCNGVRDCINGVDELKCHRWQEWEVWSKCGTVTESCTRIRHRSCVNSEGVVVNSAECYGAYPNGLNENQIDICPACLLNASVLPTGTISDVSVTTEEGYPSAFSPTSISKGGSANFVFDFGAQTAVAIAVTILILAIILCVLIAACKLKHTGFWRPPTKLPRSQRSDLPGMNVVGHRRIQPLTEISHPYPMKRPKKCEIIETKETLPTPIALKASTTTLHSLSSMGVDQQNYSMKAEIKVAGKTNRDALAESSRLSHIGRTVV